MKSQISVTLVEIMKDFGPSGVLLEALNDKGVTVSGISAVEDCQPGDLVFVDKKEYLTIIRSRRPAAVVTSTALKGSVAETGNFAILVAANISLAHALIKGMYGNRDFSKSGWTGIHSTAVIHETAKVGEGTVIEPRVVIGQNVKIGDHSRIMAGSVIENDAVIGSHTHLHPLVMIGYGCRIGNHVTIGSGTVIGSSGFGYAQDKQRKSHHIPQTGIVVIQDHVNIGANNCIDRAAYHETRIGEGTKIDNLCHIAHNVIIGDNCLLTAMLCVAGSTTIGNRVITSGQTGILDHVEVGDDVVLVQRAGVSKDIKKPGAYAGAPVQPMAEYMKNTAVFRGAVELRKRVSDLEKAVGLKKSDGSQNS